MGKQNMAMFEKAMRMFNPFGKGQPGAAGMPPAQANGQDPASAAKATDTSAGASNDAAIDDLKRKLDELQGQLAELSKKS